MRLSLRYRIFKKSNTSLKKFPLRILNFNRPKWKLIQQKLNSKQNFRVKFIRHLQVLRKSLYFYERISRSFKSRLFLKNNFNKDFDNSITNAFFKKHLTISDQKSRKMAFLVNLILPHFRIDVLLCNLNLFLTVYQARQSLNNNEIKVNGKFVFGNYFLKKFDIISFTKNIPSTLISREKIVSKYSSNNYFFSFVEIDFYTKTIVILKDFNSLVDSEVSFLVSDRVDIKKFKDYF